MSVASLAQPQGAPEDFERLRTIARELAGLGPWETLQFTPAGAYLERRFKVPLLEEAIMRTLAPFNPHTHHITGARFANDDLILLRVVETGSPESLIQESPTNAAKAER